MGCKIYNYDLQLKFIKYLKNLILSIFYIDKLNPDNPTIFLNIEYINGNKLKENDFVQCNFQGFI